MENELKHLLDKIQTANDKDKIDYYLKIASIYQEQKARQESLKYYKIALELAKQNDFTELLANCYFLLAKHYQFFNILDKSLRYYLYARQIYETLNDDKKLSNIYQNCGIIYWKTGNYADSLENLYMSIKKNEVINDENGISESYNNIGLVYWKLNKLQKALEYFFKSLKIKEKNNRKKAIAITLNNIGNVYFDMGNTIKALNYHRKSYELSKDSNNKETIANSLNNIGVDYKKLKQYDKALEFLFKSLKLKLQLKNDSSRANTYKNIGKVYKLQKEYNKALKYLEKALTIATKNNSKLVLKDCFLELSEIYEEMKDFKLALEYKNKYLKVLKSIFQEINNKKISNLEVKISVEHMLQKTQIIKQKNIELENEIKERKKTEKTLKSYREHLEMINRILRHDIMNKLSVIQSSVRLYLRSKDKKYLDTISENVRLSSDLIYRMKNLESYLLTHSNLKIIELSKVLEEVLSSFPDKKIKVLGNGKVLADEALISVFDNLIFNAYKHGKTDEVEIKIEPHGDVYLVSVIDFGIGIPNSVKDKIFDKNYVFGKSGNTGLGLYIVKQSVKRYGGEITVSDNQPTGTIFKFSLKAIK